MTKKILLCLGLYASLSSLGFADTKIIILKDGSQVKGELIAVKDGTYTVKTDLMGEVNVSADQVTSISALEAAATAPAMRQTIEATQQKLMTDPAVMAEIQAMAQDPQIVQLLSDPGLVKAVVSKDVQSLQNNPNGQALINNPKMRALMEKVVQQMQPVQEQPKSEPQK